MQTVKYYLTHKEEFYGESAHELMLEILTKNSEDIKDDTLVLGIDVGANIGKYIPNIRKICREKNHKIVCIEPNILNFNILKSQATGDDVLLFNTAVSNEEGIKPFFAYHKNNYAGNPHGGLFSSKCGELVDNIRVTTLDLLINSIISKFNVQDNYTIKFVKIDTEGHDSMVIKGMVNILPKIKYIIFECSDCLDDIRGSDEISPMKNVVELLDIHGFDVYRLGTKRLIKVNGEGWNDIYEKVKFWSNCFAVRKSDSLMKAIIDENGFFR